MANGESFVLHDTPVEFVPAQGTVCILAWANWSKPSREFKSIFEEVSLEHHNGVRFATRTPDDLMMAIPRSDFSALLVLPVVLFSRDGVLVSMLPGAQTKETLSHWIDQCCKGDNGNG